MNQAALQTLNFYQRLQFELEVEKLVSQNRELHKANDELKHKLIALGKNPFKDNLTFDFKELYQMEIQRLNESLDKETRLTKTWRFAFYQLARQMDPGADHARTSLISAQALVLLEEAMKKLEYYENNNTNSAPIKHSQNEDKKQLPVSPSAKKMQPKTDDIAIESGAHAFFSKLKHKSTDDTSNSNDDNKQPTKNKLFSPIPNNLNRQFNELLKSDTEDYASTRDALTDITNEEFNDSNTITEAVETYSPRGNDCPDSNIYSPLNYLCCENPPADLPESCSESSDFSDQVGDETTLTFIDSGRNDSTLNSPNSIDKNPDSPTVESNEIANDSLNRTDGECEKNYQILSSKDVAISKHADSDALFLIESSPLLKHLSTHVQQNMSKRLRHISFYPNASVIIQGEDPDGFYIIASGTASICYYDGAGRPLIESSKLGTGDIFGHHNLISGKPHSAYVVARSHLTLFKLSSLDWSELRMNEFLVDLPPMPVAPVIKYDREELVDFLINVEELKRLKIRKIAKYLKVSHFMPGESVSDDLLKTCMSIVKRGTFSDKKSSKIFVENNVIYPGTLNVNIKALDYCTLLTLSADKVEKYIPTEQIANASNSMHPADKSDNGDSISTKGGVEASADDSVSPQKSRATEKSKSKSNKSKIEAPVADKSATIEPASKTSLPDEANAEVVTVAPKDHPLYNFFRSINNKNISHSQDNFKTPFPLGTNLSKWFSSCFEKHVLKQDANIVSPEIFIVTKGKIITNHIGYFGIETNVGSVPKGVLIGLDSDSECSYRVDSASATVYILPCQLHDKMIMCLKEWDKIKTFVKNIVGGSSLDSEISNILALETGESADLGKYVVYAGRVSTKDGVKTVGDTFTSEAVAEYNSILVSLFLIKSCLKKSGKNTDKHVSFSTKLEVMY